MEGSRVLEEASISALVSTSSREESRSLELGSSTLSADISGDGDGDDNSCGSLSFTCQEEEEEEERTPLQYENEVGGGLGLAMASTSEGFSPLGWPLGRSNTSKSGSSTAPLAHVGGRDTVIWDNLAKDKLDHDLSGGAWGYGGLVDQKPLKARAGAVSPVLFKGGAGCGACYKECEGE